MSRSAFGILATASSVGTDTAVFSAVSNGVDGVDQDGLLHRADRRGRAWLFGLPPERLTHRRKI
ncbi:hypothetical protein CGZ69_06645 [Streptomyces peucetius subsp. caesius ATCC 27952]|nr:hypothetical protein CGZ69_06645 [Streptomyces peucetius subsp. caesius ATCC 27952]